MHEFTGGVSIAGEDGAAVAKFVAVHQLQRAVIVRHADNAQYRSKNLFPPDGHIRRHVVEQRTADIVPVIIA